VQQHGKLKYPEGTACAEVLKAGASRESLAAHAEALHEPVDAAAEEAGSDAKTIFSGFGIGLAYKIANVALSGWKDVSNKVFGPPLEAGSIGVEVSPELLGVGYIIGPRIASIMCAGGVLAFLVLIPAIKFFGQFATKPLPPGTIPISEMDPHAIRVAYVQYIAAGAVAAGGIVSLIRSLPTIWHGLKEGLKDLRGSGAARESVVRTDRDMSMRTVLIGIFVLIVAIMAARPLHMNFLGALLIVAFGFLFVTVSSRLTGEIGSSSNPISGMTVATLLITSLVFLAIGWTGPTYYVTALSVGAIVCIAASNGGTTSQDLKTGFLIGATPRFQQIAILIGALASAIVLGPILLKLNDGATVYVPQSQVKAVKTNAQVPATAVASLPPYNDPKHPNVQGRILAVTETAPLAGLEPGQYLVSPAGAVTARVVENFPATLKAPPGQISKTTETIQGPQAKSDSKAYHIWQKTDSTNGLAGRYLVDDAGTPVYLVDPGINGAFNVRPDGTEVKKFDAPKATLMSYIIKGILNRQLPWGLVILGVMISLVLEMSGIPSLAFAVGVYLPLSSSSPILVGGMIRLLTDKYLARKYAHRNLSEEQLVAEGDKSPGVLLASGYIAGGAIAGIGISFMQGVLVDVNAKLQAWNTAHNPFFGGGQADLLSLLPFAVLCVLLYLVGRDVLLRRREAAAGPEVT
jgi:uncharacterized oligopeptide transporter (OPT) family protein